MKQKASDQSTAIDSVVTDGSGYYSIPLPDSGVYNLIGDSKEKSVLISNIHITDTQTFEVATVTVQKPGTIEGVTFLPGLDSINQIRVTMYIPGTGFIVKPSPGGQFTFPRLPPGSYKLIFDPTNTNYFVKVMDIKVDAGSTLDLKTIVLYGKNITGIPVLDIGSDVAVPINTNVVARFSATDTLGQIVMYWIDSDGDGVFEDSSATSGTRAFKLDSVPGTRKFIVQVMDNDGNRVTDSTIFYILQNVIKDGIRLDDMETGDSLNENGWIRYVEDDSRDGGNSTFPNFVKNRLGQYCVKPTSGEGLLGTYGFKIDYQMGNRDAYYGGANIRAGIMLSGGNTVSMSVYNKLSFWAKGTVPFSLTVQIRTKSDTTNLMGYAQSVEISTEWKEYVIDVTGGEFHFPPWITSAKKPFDAENVVGISWLVNGTLNVKNSFTIDNVYLRQ
jgi:hypothetical protein